MLRIASSVLCFFYPMMFDPAYDARTIFFSLVPAPSLCLTPLILGTRVFAWSCGHTHFLITAHIRGLEWRQSGVWVPKFLSLVNSMDKLGFLGAQHINCVSDCWQGTLRSPGPMPSSYRYRTETQRWRVTVFLKFCRVSQSRVCAEFLHSAPWLPAPLSSTFSIEYEHFSGTYLMRCTELLYLVGVQSWIKYFLWENTWAFWIAFTLKPLFSIT